jgi:hypothetical protein
LILAVSNCRSQSKNDPCSKHDIAAIGAHCYTDIAGRLIGGEIVGDRIQLQQVIVNLTVNALQAMTLLAPAERTISVRKMLSDPETVRCSNEDGGPGIDPKHLPHLFDSFFTTKDSLAWAWFGHLSALIFVGASFHRPYSRLALGFH